ncbi:MAG: hypothetical protein ACK480_10735 [Planctomycetota bacterium]
MAQSRFEELADQAFWNSKQAQAIADARVVWSIPKKGSLITRSPSPQQMSFLLCISKEWENQARFESAVNALRLHYGIAACRMGLEINSQAIIYAIQQASLQEELIELGGQVDDITAIKRTKIELEDQRLGLDAKLQKLREQLALLVGNQIACNYDPEFICAPTGELNDRCNYEDWAIDQRRELQVLRYVRQHAELINEESLDLLVGLGSVPQSLRSLLGSVKPLGVLHRRLPAEELAKRRAILDRWIADRSEQIRVEASNAYTDKTTALERWKLAIAKSDALSERVERLSALGDLKGNKSQQIQAQLELLASKGQEIQRWLDWHLADCDLQEASGRIGFWNLESNLK